MCCTPYVATIVAGVLCICFVNLGWNVPLILGISFNKTEILTLTPIDISKLGNPFAVYGITILLTFINIQLLVFSCLLLKANHDKRLDWIGAWLVLILTKTLINISLGGYFLHYYRNIKPVDVNIFRLAALFSGIFFFWPIVNIMLFCLVMKRHRDICKAEINEANLSLPAPLNDSQPPPYTPATFTSHHVQQTADPAPITGWSSQPLLNYDNASLGITN